MKEDDYYLNPVTCYDLVSATPRKPLNGFYEILLEGLASYVNVHE